jgi:hypothetical protein
MTDAIGARFVHWLERQVVLDARGDRVDEFDTKPADRLWLGRLAPEAAAWKQAMGERGQRLDPCSGGFRFRPATEPPWAWNAEVRFRVWTKQRGFSKWRKSEPVVVTFPVAVPDRAVGSRTYGSDEIAAALQAANLDGYHANVDVEIARESDGLSLAVTLVNISTEQRGADRNLYEASLQLEVGELQPFVLDALPDSFRYDRHIIAYGVYGGVQYDGRFLTTSDVIGENRQRPTYWDEEIGPEPDLRFETLADDPMPSLQQLVDSLRRWGELHWSESQLDQRAADDDWTEDMRGMAGREAKLFEAEVGRCERGLSTLVQQDVLRAFQLTNRAFVHSGAGRYDRWRPFQLGFLLSSLPGLVDAENDERGIVDTLWFATGGGKTETYLGIIVFSALWDRIRGKQNGITAWSRFPLRMLSLQQTQRFAEALAGAELERRKEGIEGAPFSLGFLVGRNGTPNRIRDDAGEGAVEAGDTDMPARYQVLLRCPFCRSRDLELRFNRRHWRLEHFCREASCPWPKEGLPFYVVDEEIFRFLPTAVVGTLDKAASIGMQAAMRGLYASPIARCTGPGHGYAYAPRSHTQGCLVPDCSHPLEPLDQANVLFAPTVRVQDELHLLRGGLGAIDSHYETLLDHLYRATGASLAKIVASSATLAGYETQVATLYDREASAFPRPGPQEGVSFWTKDQELLARRFVGLAPRGQTQEFANDRTAESLQRAVRRLLDEPQDVCREIGVSPEQAAFLLLNYGTHVVYGSTVRDVEAAARSFETQPGVEPLNVRTLTGATPLDEVRLSLDRLDKPEPDFADRIHVICASSMMSHGVDVERFNVITMLGMPLATAEFIQTTARIGRRLPGLVIVLHRMGVERDASVFRSFDVFVRHGDRFIEPIAITRKSRRVLDHTFPGLFMARLLGVHEPERIRLGGKQLTTVTQLRQYVQQRGTTEEEEFIQLCDALGLNPANDDDPLVVELRRLIRLTFREINDPATKARWPSEATPGQPMLSLREVETQIPIHVGLNGGGRR